MVAEFVHLPRRLKRSEKLIRKRINNVSVQALLEAPPTSVILGDVLVYVNIDVGEGRLVPLHSSLTRLQTV